MDTGLLSVEHTASVLVELPTQLGTTVRRLTIAVRTATTAGQYWRRIIIFACFDMK